MKRIHSQKPDQQADNDDATIDAPPTDSTKRDEHLAALDEILDDIDEVLEHNATEFVATYVQKGGQ